jgi:glycosyltransferase involved in cell wall biosynthesis
MNILFIVPYVPNLIRVRSYNLIRSLTARGHRVTVMTLSTGEEDDVAKLEDHCHRVYAYELPTWRSLYNTLAAIPTSTPLQAMYCWQPALANRSIEIIESSNKKVPYDVIHIEHLRGAGYGLHLKEYLSKFNLQIPIVWDSVDCITYLFSQAAALSARAFSRWLTRFELGRTQNYEGYLIRQFDWILVTSQADRRALLSLTSADSPAPNISVLPNGVDLAYFSPDNSVARQDATLVVSGKMSYHANVSMVLHLVHEIMPLVWARKPEVKLWVVGKDPTREIISLASNHNILVTGTVSDIRPYLRKAILAVIPLTYGAGSQFKVLEAMACGTPVISTSQAVSALEARPGQDLLVADQPAEFAETILALLDDREQRHKFGAAGRQYVEQHHNWDHIAANLEEIYLTVIDEKQKIKPL